MKKTITTEKLQAMRKGAKGFLLVDLLASGEFAKDHIPGACNVPIDAPDFAKAVAIKAAGSKGKQIVLYGSGPDSDATAKALRLLVQDNFTNVFAYEGGLAAWNESKRARQARAGKPTG